MSESGQTILTGQGVRWVMSRRKQSATYKNIKLSALAASVAKANKVKVDYQAKYDPEYSHVDQSGISDYQLLLREVEASGLMISEKDGTITIKERSGLKETGLVLSRGLNLISYKITDKAPGNGDDEISKVLPQTAKTTIDPVAGKVVQVKPDVTSGQKPTGASAPKVAGTVKGGQQTQLSEQGKTKRIAGLPSTFVVPLTLDTLAFEPLSTARTKGFPGVIDRIWVLKSVQHKLADQTTTLAMVSPIEVLDNGSAEQIIPGIKKEAPVPNGKGWIYPCSGTVTSLYGMRLHPIRRRMEMHNGTDIGNGINTPIYAVQSGIVSFVGDRGKGGGNQVQVKHSGEYAAYESIFLHNQSIVVSVGQQVTQGQQIAFMGNTGIGSGSHSHFTIKQNGSYINPSSIWKKLATEGTRITAKEPV